MGVVEKLPSGRKPYTSPRPIEAGDEVAQFDCEKPLLNDWLKQKAVKNQGKASRTFVVCASRGEHAGNVVGYYSLASGAVSHEDAPNWGKRNMPNPVPVFVLGRLAVDHGHHGNGIGAALLRDAFLRSLEASRHVGARALIVHAINDEAVTFYTPYGFQQFPAGTRTLFLPMETIARSI